MWCLKYAKKSLHEAVESFSSSSHSELTSHLSLFALVASAFMILYLQRKAAALKQSTYNTSWSHHPPNHPCFFTHSSVLPRALLPFHFPSYYSRVYIYRNSYVHHLSLTIEPRANWSKLRKHYFLLPFFLSFQKLCSKLILSARLLAFSSPWFVVVADKSLFSVMISIFIPRVYILTPSPQAPCLLSLPLLLLYILLLLQRCWGMKFWNKIASGKKRNCREEC